jgi:hypothetical protein
MRAEKMKAFFPGQAAQGLCRNKQREKPLPEIGAAK